MPILLYDLVGHDVGRPFSPHCWKIKMALAHKGLTATKVPTRFLEVPKVEGGVSKVIPVTTARVIAIGAATKSAFSNSTTPRTIAPMARTERVRPKLVIVVWMGTFAKAACTSGSTFAPVRNRQPVRGDPITFLLTP